MRIRACFIKYILDLARKHRGRRTCPITQAIGGRNKVEWDWFTTKNDRALFFWNDRDAHLCWGEFSNIAETRFPTGQPQSSRQHSEPSISACRLLLSISSILHSGCSVGVVLSVVTDILVSIWQDITSAEAVWPTKTRSTNRTAKILLLIYNTKTTNHLLYSGITDNIEKFNIIFARCLVYLIPKIFRAITC